MLILAYFIFKVGVYIFNKNKHASWLIVENKNNVLKYHWVTLSQKVHVLLSLKLMSFHCSMTLSSELPRETGFIFN